jgi:hypothetical protein
MAGQNHENKATWRVWLRRIFCLMILSDFMGFDVSWGKNLRGADPGAMLNKKRYNVLPF